MPYSKEEKERAKKVDLISLPRGMQERCSNCKFLDKNNYCQNKRVMFHIERPDDECCGLWDNNLIDRTRTQ